MDYVMLCQKKEQLADMRKYLPKEALQSFDKSFEAINEAFSGRTLVMPEIDEDNRVVLAFAGDKLETTINELYERAQMLRARWKLGCIRWVNGLKAFNHTFKEPVISL